ncbi:hypothetical protein [Paraburkholderia sp. J8-2]|uniref:hypothetical protein n=1 Tax=Paraburkholderia sp. J8-2 TaxID=2805440 RepID=UPI002AB75E5A|nr:hypothetical protein [Paraburkholderia sp. J8-2]
MKRKITIELLTWIPALLLSCGAAYVLEAVAERFEWFGLSHWQILLVTFALGAALGEPLYRGVASPLVGRYIVWDLKRKASRSSDNGN